MLAVKRAHALALAASLAFLPSGDGARAQGKKPEGPEVKDYAVPEAYVTLANHLSNLSVPYHAKAEAGRDKEKLAEGIPFFLGLEYVADRLKGAKRPAIAAAVKELNGGVARSKAAVEAFKEEITAAGKRRAETNDAVDRGEFRRKVETIEFVRNSDGTTRQVTKTHEVDDGAMVAVFGKAIDDVRRDSAYRALLRDRSRHMERSRVAAWRALIPRLGNIYPSQTALRDPLTFSISSPDPRTGEGPRFTCRNTGKISLTNVTLVVELVHFTTAPETTSLRAYFLPEFKAGRAIELAPRLDLNCRTEEYRKGRPGEAVPDYLRRDGPGDPFGFPRSLMARPELAEGQLADVAGVVRIRHAVYAEQGTQPDRSTTFPRMAEEGAQMELRSLYRMINLSMAAAQPPRPSHREAFDKIPFGWAARVAQRLPQFLSPDSEARRQVKLLTEDPRLFCEDFATRERLKVTRAITPDALFRGTWRSHVPDDPGKAVYDKEVAMVVGDFPPGKDTAPIIFFNPANPKQRSTRTGRIVTGRDGIVSVLVGREPGEGSSPSAPKRETAAEQALRALQNEYSRIGRRAYEKLTPAELDEHKARLAEADAKVRGERRAAAAAKAEEERTRYPNGVPEFRLYPDRSGFLGSPDEQPGFYKDHFTFEPSHEPELVKAASLATRLERDKEAASKTKD